MQLKQVMNLANHPIHDPQYQQACKQQLDQAGGLILKNFLTPVARAAIIDEGKQQQAAAFYTNSGHNVYLTQKDPAFDDNHPRNQWV